MAPPDARASASFVCAAFLSYCLRWHPGSDRLGTIDLPCRRASGGVLQCRAIVPNGTVRRASGGVFRLFGLFVLLVAVALGSDRLGTIDLPCRRSCGGVLQRRAIVPNGSARRASGGVLQRRAIVPNGSARRASGGVLRLFGLFVLLSAVASRFRSIGDNRSTMPTHSGGVIQCRAIVPNGSARRASGGVLRLFGFFILLSAVALGSDRLGTIDLPCRRTAALSYSVEPLSPMAPPDAQAAASYVCSAFLSYCLRWL
jgi:hypothetical protein